MITAPTTFVANVQAGADVLVTDDNGNVAAAPTACFDGANRQSNETSVAISPANSSIMVVSANDYRLVPVFGDSWLGFYVSADGGATWFNTMVPGFPSDTSFAGVTSPLRGLDGAGDPTVRFDAAGNLYVAGIAFNRNFDQEDRNLDTVVFVAKYNYTPGSAAGACSSTAAANPPNFTYAFTTIVDRGAVGFAVPIGDPMGFAGRFDDKNWLAVDTTASSPCYGTVYYSFTKFTGVAGAFPIVFTRSTDGGASFAQPRPISQRGRTGTVRTQGSNIAVAPNGRVYVSYFTFPSPSDPTTQIQVATSTDCGRSFNPPVTAATFTPMPRQAAGLSFRTPTESWIAADDTNSNRVYVVYMALTGATPNANIFVVRSTTGGATWGAPAQVNDDATSKHQFWPTIAVSNGDVHVAWYDFRNSANPADPASGNSALDVYYASSETTGVAYPAFSANLRVTDISHDPNCRMFGGGTVGFHGDYIELAARWNGADHTVLVAWADNRDVNPCDLDPAPGPASNSTGNRNQNIYADVFTVAP